MRSHVVTTAFTIITTGAWLVTFGIRLGHPNYTGPSSSVDAAMLLVLAYWFNATGIRQRGGS